MISPTGYRGSRMTDCALFWGDCGKHKYMIGSKRFADLYEAQQYRAALLELIIHNTGGWPDRRTLIRVEELCQAAMGVLEDAECATRLRSITEYARALFSEQTHREWDRGSIGGADFLRLEILRALHSLNGRLCALEANLRQASA